MTLYFYNYRAIFRLFRPSSSASTHSAKKIVPSSQSHSADRMTGVIKEAPPSVLCPASCAFAGVPFFPFPFPFPASIPMLDWGSLGGGRVGAGPTGPAHITGFGFAGEDSFAGSVCCPTGLGFAAGEASFAGCATFPTAAGFAATVAFCCCSAGGCIASLNTGP